MERRCRDGALLGAVAVALAVTQGWNWTLLGSTKAGIAAVGVVGY